MYIYIILYTYSTCVHGVHNTAGNFGESETAILEAVIHWNYHSISRGKDSLFGRLHHMDGSEWSTV